MTWTSGRLAEQMEDAVDHATNHVLAGGLPFVGVVMNPDGHISAFGVNRVAETGDPTAHAEIVAMRDMQAITARDDLADSVLLATGEPCGLCYQKALHLGIRRVYVAVSADTVAQWGFDYRGSYRALGVDPTRRADIYRALPVERGLEPFQHYAALHRVGPVFQDSNAESPNRKENMPWNGSTSP